MPTTKAKVLRILEENRGQSISGSKLAKTLNISRAAIWKIIEELRNEGFEINAMTNKGYCLTESSDILSVEGILLHSQNPQIKREQIHVYKTLESTNQLAKKIAVAGGSHGTVILAEEQTQGRGRLGRSFFSPKGTGLYMSIILCPEGTADQAVLTTTAASVAVCRALSATLGIEAQIKWVNDIFVNSRKVSGILTEAISNFETGCIESLILGIGINVSTEKCNFPEELQGIAGSLLRKNSSNTISRNQLAASIIHEIFTVYETINSGDFIPEYKSRCFVLGKEILVHRGIEEYNAKAIDINSQGALIIERQDGSKETLNSGEISIRTKTD
ncbi:MAG: biotin--[acetyl-CoA-carboxylase] ligase [Eubacteriales bacterium]|nr:biotin--[acetyl-CoA-carboxylase] ligase [Eubacteriales bacterium]